MSGTDALIVAARAREAAATPGPWEQRGAFIDSIFSPPIVAETEHWDDPNAALIVAARNDYPLLLDVLEALDRLIDDDPCRFDHHGGCQTHGFLEPDPGDPWPCGMAQARAAIKAWKAAQR